MSLAEFTWTTRARPIVEVGIGDTRVPVGQATWDHARWDDDAARWSGDDPTWIDVTCDVFEYRCEYGRRRSIDRYVPGVAQVLVNNATGWADPHAANPPGVLTMRPGRPVRVGVVHDVYGTRWLFRGFVDAMTPTYDPTRTDVVLLDCVDALGEVNRVKLVPVVPPAHAGETVDARIDRLLDLAKWSDVKRELDPASDTLVASDMGGQVADLLGQAAESNGGSIFGDTDGNVVYRGRDWQMFVPGTPPDGTIGNVEPGHTIPPVPEVPAHLDFTKGTVSTVAPIIPPAQQSLTSDPTGVTITQTGTTTLTGVPGNSLRSAKMRQTNRRQLVFPGVVSNYLSIPDAPNLNITGDFEVVARIAPNDWTPAANYVVATKDVAAAPNTTVRSWIFRLGTNGALGLLVSVNGTAQVAAGSSILPAGVAVDGAALWVKATRVAASGLVSFYYAPDAAAEPTTWTAAGTASPGAGNMTNGAQALMIGARNSQGTNEQFAGRIARVIVRNGIAGTTVLDVDEANAATVAAGSSSFVATTGQTVTVFGTGPNPCLAGATGTVSTPDPGVLPASFVLVYRARNNNTAGFPISAAQTTGADPRSWQSYPTLINTRIYFEATPDGLWANRQSRWADRPVPALNVDRTEAVAVTSNAAGRHLMTAWSYDDASGTWTAGVSRDTGVALTPFDVTTTLIAGNGFGAGERLYWSEMRTGTDPRAGTLLYRFDAAERTGTGLSYVDPRGRTWTLSAANAIAPGVAPIVQALADVDVWQFDANDYPGTGTSYVDPRGRTWTLSAAGAIVPKVPAIPEIVVPPDVCPVQWDRPFARQDMATRVIIGRDLLTAKVVDDDVAQLLYGIEPFERVDLLTASDATLDFLAARILDTRSAESAPRVRAVTLDARTSDEALDLMSTVDVYRPSRYRCRLEYNRGLVFDAEHFATGVAHVVTPRMWSLELNLDLAAPYEAGAARWDTNLGWDRALWSSLT